MPTQEPESQPGNADRNPQAPLPDARKYQMSEAALGGADAVEKTSYVTGSGTSPEARHVPGTPAASEVRGGGGLGTVWIALGVLVVLAILAFALGFFH